MSSETVPSALSIGHTQTLRGCGLGHCSPDPESEPKHALWIAKRSMVFAEGLLTKGLGVSFCYFVWKPSSKHSSNYSLHFFFTCAVLHLQILTLCYVVLRCRTVPRVNLVFPTISLSLHRAHKYRNRFPTSNLKNCSVFSFYEDRFSQHYKPVL